MEEKQSLVVLASNYEQFLNWCRETKTNPKDSIYLTEIHRVYGLRNFKVITHGTWEDNPTYTPMFLDELAGREAFSKHHD